MSPSIQTIAPITLYAFSTSPFVAKVHSYLIFKKLPFNTVYVHPLTRREIIFSGQKQCPVLKIGDEWKKDSSAIGVWLEDKFPNPSYLGHSPHERELILEWDKWATQTLIGYKFRLITQTGYIRLLKNASVLSGILEKTNRLPLWARALWPVILRKSPFVHQAMGAMDFSEPLDHLEKRTYQELIDRIGKGPFFGGRKTPSMADLSAAPQLVGPVLMGLPHQDGFTGYPEIMDWLRQLKPYLESERELIPKKLLKSSLEELLQ